MNRFIIIALAIACLAASKPPAKAPPPKEDTSPKPYENAEHKFRFKAPANWENVGAACHGSLFNFFVPMNPGSATARDGDGTTTYGDIFTIAVNPLKNEKDDAATVIAQLQEEVIKTDPNAKFKTMPNVKIAGHDAAVVIVNLPKDKDGVEPARAQRHAFVLKDGKAFGFIIFGHQSSLASSTALAQNNVLKTFEWTDAQTQASAK